MAYSLDVSLALGAANSGLTLEAQVVDTAGANVGSPITTGFVEFGSSGNYLWHTSAMPDGHRGGIVFQVSPGGVVKAFAAINPEEVENPDVKTSSVAASVWAFGTRTLTSFGTLLTDVAAAVWTYASRTLTQAIAAVTPPPVVEGDTITVLRGETITIPFTDLGSLVGRTKLWFTIKASPNDTDENAIVQIEETGGLLRLNGAATTSAWGSIVVTDENAGNGTITIKADASVSLVPFAGRYYDIQMKTATSISTPTSGRSNITADVTRAIS